MTELKPEEIYPKVGITIAVKKNDKYLLGKRKGSHGAGEWAFPGGGLDYMESISGCVQRELAEETGIEVKNLEFIRVYNLTEYPPKHWIDIAVKAEWVAGEPKIIEPDKCEEWGWFGVNELPEPLFLGCKSIFEALETGRNFFDSGASNG